MLQRKPAGEPTHYAFVEKAPSHVRIAGDECAATEGPARKLQKLLEVSVPASDVQQWSARKTTAFVAGFNLLAWTAIVMAIVKIL